MTTRESRAPRSLLISATLRKPALSVGRLGSLQAGPGNGPQLSDPSVWLSEPSVWLSEPSV